MRNVSRRARRVRPRLARIAERLETRTLFATFVVTTPADPGPSGQMGLREAIVQANATPGLDTIAFNLASSGVVVITPHTDLPQITSPVTIDGTTEAGYAGTPIVVIDATREFFAGFRISAGNSTVRGLVIDNSGGDGIQLTVQGGDTIQGNYIGTDATGTVTKPNFGEGIRVDGVSGNTIGGPLPFQGNVISDSGAAGLALLNGSSRNLVQGNFIGTDASGTHALGNSGGGIYDAGSDNTIGGTASNDRNLVSGNGNNGISVSGYSSTSSGNVVQGNYVGTDVTGMFALPNQMAGINLFGAGGLNGLATNNLIGGPTPQARNVISGNNGDGIQLVGTVNANQIQGNYIGIASDGQAALGNIGNGIISLGASNNIIGGMLPGEGNVISSNTKAGVQITGTFGDYGAPSSGNQVLGDVIGTTAAGLLLLPPSQGFAQPLPPRGNQGGGVDVRNGGHDRVKESLIYDNFPFGLGALLADSVTFSDPNLIFSNVGLGIDLGEDGVTPNHPNGSGVGPNNLENYPVLTSASSSPAGTHIIGTLNSTPNTAVHIEFFSNPTADPSGHGQGEFFLGSTDVTTGADSNASFDLTLPPIVAAGAAISSTATDSSGNTSEFSQDVTATASALAVASANFIYTRSPNALTFRFNEPVTAGLAAIHVQDGTGNTVIPQSYSFDPSTDTATFAFSGVLPSGNYSATLAASAVTDQASRHLASNYVLSFFSLTGDVNHDRHVNFSDLLILAQNYGAQTGATFGRGDLNYDGKIDFADLLILAQNYGRSLPAPAVASPASAGSSSLLSDLLLRKKLRARATFLAARTNARAT